MNTEYRMENKEYSKWGTVFFLLCTILFSIFYILPTEAKASVTLGQANMSVLSNGLVGRWTFDGNLSTSSGIRDQTGNGNNGYIVGTNTSTSSRTSIGKIGQAFSFQGLSTGGVNVGNSATLNPSRFTISAWVNTTNPSYTYNEIYSNTRDSSTPYNGINFFFSGQTLRGQIFNTNSYTLTAGVTVATSTWYHAVFTYDGAFMRLYVNGVQVAATAQTVDPGTPASFNTYLGSMGYTSGSTYTMTGKLDDERIYNRALSAQEVALLYASGNANAGHSNAPGAASSSFNFGLTNGLVGYWPLDGSTTNWKTNTTSDASGNGNTGTLVSLGTTTAPAIGKIGQALNFNGTSSYVDAGNITATNGVSALTVSVWVKPSTLTSLAGLVTKGHVSDSTQLAWNIQESTVLTGGSTNRDILLGVSTSLIDPSTYAYTTTNSLLSVGTWVHAVMVFDGTQLTNATRLNLFVNGVQQTLTFHGTIPATISSGATSHVAIGAFYDPQRLFNGSIDDVRIYNRALSYQEVQQLYKLGNTNAGHSNTTSGTGINSGLVGYWTFDGSAMNWKTGLALDSSGNGNNGTLVSLGTTTAPAIGKIGQALNFNGSSGKITYGTNLSTFQFGMGSFSISAWVRPVNKPAGPGTPAIFGVGLGASSSRFGLDINYFATPGSNRLLGFAIDDAGNVTNQAPTQVLPNNQWSYVTMVVNRSSNTMTIYVNAVPTNINNISISNLTSTISPQGVAMTGSNVNGTADWLQGGVDDIRVYNRALSAQEVAQLYSMGK